MMVDPIPFDFHVILPINSKIKKTEAAATIEEDIKFAAEAFLSVLFPLMSMPVSLNVQREPASVFSGRRANSTSRYIMSANLVKRVIDASIGEKTILQEHNSLKALQATFSEKGPVSSEKTLASKSFVAIIILKN